MEPQHTNHLLESILLLLVLSVGAVTAFRALRLPPILGYLLVGILTGEHALSFIKKNDDLAFMGEVGVVFLLFAIGLEFSLKQFIAMRKIIIGLGGLQVIISTLSGMLILMYFGIAWPSALVAGGAMAMSSTAIVVKQLADQAEMRRQHGQLALGVLLFQDLAVVPFLILIPLLAGGANVTSDASSLFLNIAADAGLFVLMLLVGHYTLRPLFHYISRAESTELFNITVLLVALTSAWVTQTLGLSLALGAFLAGMLLSETEYKHQIESEIRPFRDILMGIFFITVGTKLDFKVVLELWQPVLLLVAGLTFGKGLLIAGLTRLFAVPGIESLRTGLVLAQGGEFGFALLALALGNDLLKPHAAQATLAAIVISMALSPLIIRYNEKISASLLTDLFAKTMPQPVEPQAFQAHTHELEGHVLLCGYRRMGQNLGQFLHEHGVPFIALDLDARIVEEAWSAGDPVYYADASRPEILQAAGLDRARMAVITVLEVDVAKRITHAIRQKNSHIPILIRTRGDSHIEELERLGATTVLPEILEATIVITQRMLEELGFSPNEVFQVLEKIRGDGYRSLRSYYHGEREKVSSTGNESFLHTFMVQSEDYANGKTIAELELDAFAVTIKALRRGAIRGDQPSSEMLLQEGDILVLESKGATFDGVEELLKLGRKHAKSNPSLA